MSDSINCLYTLSKVKLSFEDIFPKTWEIVLNLVLFSLKGGDPIPIFILLKFSVCNFLMISLRPLCPPELPFFLNLIVPRGRSISSTIITVSYTHLTLPTISWV